MTKTVENIPKLLLNYQMAIKCIKCPYYVQNGQTIYLPTFFHKKKIRIFGLKRNHLATLLTTSRGSRRCSRWSRSASCREGRGRSRCARPTFCPCRSWPCRPGVHFINQFRPKITDKTWSQSYDFDLQRHG
jgi:hypothetical protein